MQLLLEAGVNVNAPGGRYGTALEEIVSKTLSVDEVGNRLLEKRVLERSIQLLRGS